MSVNNLSFRIGGEAGQGVESSGAGFIKALMRGGLHVVGVPDYYSRIRGGHNFYTVRVSDTPIYAVRDQIELLLALNAETITRHSAQLAPGGAIIIDETEKVDEAALRGRDVQLYRLPLTALAAREGNALMVNTATLAVAAGLTGFPLQYIVSVIEDNFRRKGEAVVSANRRVAEAAYQMIQERSANAFPWKLEPRPGSPARLSLTGNQAFALGALGAGCKFVAGYPMTPATPVMEYLAAHAHDWGVVVKHAESETAAINMVVGAVPAGVRALVPTSGGGYDLMTEGVSLAGMFETPLVVYLGQRPGPATGMATRTGQTELFLALHSSHGEFPRAVLAPHTPEELFSCAIRAFNLAEKYQCVVLVLSDHYLCNFDHSADVAAYDVQQVPIERGKLISPAEVEALSEYKRYALTPDGVSPRALAGSSPKAVYFATSDEHREDGHITEDPQIAAAMQRKRLRKEEGLRREMRAPYCYGPQQAELTFVSWGSSYGAVREAMELLNARGGSANLVHFVDLWPFPAEEARAALASSKRIVVVEGNARAQFAFLLHAYAGLEAHEKVLRFDGRGFTADYILSALEGK